MESDENERTPLHWAASNGDIQTVRDRLDACDDPNKGDDGGWTPLISAASCGYTHIVACLLDSGANPSLKTKQGRDAFFYAVARCNGPMTDLFFQNDYHSWKQDSTGSSCIHRAICCEKCSPSFLDLLKSNDAPFDVPDGDGNLPIHLACYENKPEIIKWLVEKCRFDTKSPKNNEGKVPKDLLPVA